MEQVQGQLAKVQEQVTKVPIWVWVVLAVILIILIPRVLSYINSKYNTSSPMAASSKPVVGVDDSESTEEELVLASAADQQ